VSRPRFLADQDLNDHILTAVRSRQPGIELYRLRDVGLASRPDAEVLQFAAERQLIVISHDTNTMIAAATARIESALPMAGLIMVHQRHTVSSAADDLALVWSASEAEEWANTIVFLPL
jgi:predicted nuclease of predicted toxin-antitoxin system